MVLINYNKKRYNKITYKNYFIIKYNNNKALINNYGIYL